MQERSGDYDSEPVQYCARCYSLGVVHDDATDMDCCRDCGSTDTKTATIDSWIKLYEGRYGHRFVERGNDPKDSLWFKMPIPELKTKLYHSRYFDPIIHRVYPGFPKGLSRTDCILLLFDKLSRDGRMDDLRYAMYDYSRDRVTTY